MKQRIQLTEAQFNELVKECAYQILNEEENEGLLRNMWQGAKQARQDRKAAEQPFKQATQQAKQASKQANRDARKYGRYVDKDLQSIEDILQHYQEYPQISRSARIIKGALSNLKTQMSNSAQNAKQAYGDARNAQQAQRDEYNTNQQQAFRNLFSGNQGNQYQQSAVAE